jgi:hypothetical protein
VRQNACSPERLSLDRRQKNHDNKQRLQIENQDNENGSNSNRYCDPNVPRKELLKHGSHAAVIVAKARAADISIK